MEERTRVRRLNQHGRVEGAVTNATSWRDTRLTEAAVLWVQLCRHDEIRRLCR